MRKGKSGSGAGYWRESGGCNKITMRVGDDEYVIAVKVGRKLYPVCPVCNAFFSSNVGYYVHLERYHGEWLDGVYERRLASLYGINYGESDDKPCVAELKKLIPEEINAVDLYEYDDGQDKFVRVAVVSRDNLFKFLNGFSCRAIDRRRVELYDGYAYINRRRVWWYFKAGSYRFTVSGEILEGLKNNGYLRYYKKQNDNNQDSRQSYVNVERVGTVNVKRPDIDFS